MFTTKEELVFIIVVISITFVILCSIIFIIIHNYVKTKTEENKNKLIVAFNAEENERNRISKELHDSIGIKLSILKLELEILSKENEGLIKNDLPIFLSETIQEVRMISRSQSSEFVLENGIVTELSQLVRKLKQLKSIDFQIEINCDLRQFKNEFQIHLYRIIQELINNTIKHSNANLIELKITDSKEELFVKYIDNGNNLYEKESNGSGLKNIITRVSLYSGNILVNSVQKNGFNFNCVFAKNNIS